MTALEHCFFCRLRTGAKICVFFSSLSCIGFLSLCFTRYLQLRDYDASPNSAFLSLFTGSVVCYLITIISAVFLFYGIIKRLTHLFMPWILCSTMSCLAVTILIVYVVISYRNAGIAFSRVEFVGFIYHVSHLIITMICTIGVWSYKGYLHKRIVYEYDYQREATIPYNFMFDPPPYESSPPSYTSNSDLVIEGEERNFDPRPDPENSLHPRSYNPNQSQRSRSSTPSIQNLSQRSRGSTPSLPPRRPHKQADHVYGNLPERRPLPATETAENQENEASNGVFSISSMVPIPVSSTEPMSSNTGSATGSATASGSATVTVTTQNETVITRPLESNSPFVFTSSDVPRVHKQSHKKRVSSRHQKPYNTPQTDGRSQREPSSSVSNHTSSRNGRENY